MRTHLKKILCTTDFSDHSNFALLFGIGLAKEFGAKLYVCHIIDLPHAGMYGEAIVNIEERQRRITGFAQKQFKQLIGDIDVDWEPLITTGNAADEIARLVSDYGIDLAVSATHGRSGLKRLMLGSVTARLMRMLSCPLMIIRGPEGETAAKNETLEIRRILVGCDFSSDSNLSFQYGLSLAQEFESELHLIHVIEPSVYEDLLKPTQERTEGFKKDLRQHLLNKLTEMVPEDARHWCTPKTVLLAGQPHEELSKYAVVNDVDLIVLGVRGHSLVEKFFVGSTTDRVVRRAGCPVLSVRPKGNEI